MQIFALFAGVIEIIRNFWKLLVHICCRMNIYISNQNLAPAGVSFLFSIINLFTDEQLNLLGIVPFWFAFYILFGMQNDHTASSSSADLFASLDKI